jgi:hypothetical protein
MKLFNTKTSVQNDDWLFWEFYDEENYYALNFLDASYLEEENQKDSKREYYLKTIIPEHKLIEGMFPPPETNKELLQLEDALIKELVEKNINCKQVYRCIYYGAKRMLFEVADTEGFEKCISNWRMIHGDYTLEIIEDEPWVMYNDFLPDEYGWLQIGNRQVYESLVGDGSDVEKLHTIECAVYGKEEDLKLLEAELIKEGGKTISLDGECLEIAFEMPLDLDEINSLTYFLLDKAEEMKCEYDGWSAAIVR